MTKDEMVALAKARNIALGDYARKTKEEIAAMLVGELPPVDKPREIVARFPGKCVLCGERYPVGARIKRHGTGKWAHAHHDAAPPTERNVAQSATDHSVPSSAEQSEQQQDAQQQDELQDEQQQDGQQDEQQPDEREPRIDEQLSAMEQQQQQPADPDAFVKAVRAAVANDGQPGISLIGSMAASAAMQVAAQIKPAQAPVDAAAVQKIVADAMAKQQPAAPREIILKIDEQPAVKIEEHTHPLFEKVLRLVGAGLNVMLVGPTQCGKSTLAEQIARALNARYGMLNCTAGASESHLTGWLLPVGDGGRFEYVPSQFVTMMEEGNSLFLLDEFDALDPNFSLVLQSIFANGTMALPHRTAKPLLVKHATARAMAAANTFGTGADIQYAGRYGQDAAALERWYVVEMGYDAALEARIAGRAAAAATPWRPVNFKQSDVQSLADWHATLRENAKGLRRAVSTRMLQKGVTALRAGCSLAEVKQDLLAGWTRDERSRAQVAS